MKLPTLSVGFASMPEAEFDPTTARLLLQRNDDEPLNECNWSLSWLSPKGYDGACWMVGNAALRLLHAAHPDVFAPHPGIVPPLPAVATTEVLIYELIKRSHTHRTRKFVPAIDELVMQIGRESESSSMPAHWLCERRPLMLYP